jgi:predicted transcriptional regulator
MADARHYQPDQAREADLVELTTSIVSAYVSHNTISPGQLPELIQAVSGSLRGLSRPAEPEPEPQTPAVPIRRSVQPDAITCLECGKTFKSIRRHLRNAHGLEPNEYRQKWGLKADYPMVTPNYAEQRSAMAKAIGLGRKKGEPAPAAKGRGRRGGKAKAEGEAPAG